MSSLKIKRFGNPDFLRKIQSENLRKLLLRFPDFFRRVQFTIPDGEFGADDLDKLAAHLVSPPSFTPGSLLDAVEMLELLTSVNGLSELQTVAPDLVRQLQAKDDSAGDVALKLWFIDPHAIERIYTKFSIDSQRTLVCFRAPEGSTVKAPTKAACKAIAADLSLHFADLFNTATSEVMPFDEEGGHAFLIRHGDVVKRFGVIDDEGKPDTKALRPLKHDVAFLIPGSCELQVSGRSEEIRELYRSVFSRHLFGNASTLKPAKRFTLEPLRTGRDCLAVPDIAEINGAALRELHLRRKRGTNLTIHRGDDVFSEIEAHGNGYLADFDLTRARFSLRVRGRRRAISLSVSPEDDALRGDTHDPLATAWLDAVRLTTHRVLEEVLANN